jgi:hypothetical protein
MTVGVDGSGETEVTHAFDAAELPVWSPRLAVLGPALDARQQVREALEILEEFDKPEKPFSWDPENRRGRAPVPCGCGTRVFGRRRYANSTCQSRLPREEARTGVGDAAEGSDVLQ